MSFKQFLSENLQFLVEYDHEKTLQSFGDKLVDRAKKDPTARQLKTASEILTAIERGDATPHKEYVRWLVRTYLNGNDKLEDLTSTIGSSLLKFNEMKKRLPAEYRDIMRVKNGDQLHALVSQHEDLLKKKEEPVVNKGSSSIIFNGPTVTIRQIDDEAASVYYGRGTLWCTAAEHNNYYDHYCSNGEKLYVVMPKKPAQLPLPNDMKWKQKDGEERTTPERYQIHAESGQCKDVFDKPFIMSKLIQKFPEIVEPLSKIPELVNASLGLRKAMNPNFAEEERKREEAKDAAMGDFMKGLWDSQQ